MAEGCTWRTKHSFNSTKRLSTSYVCVYPKQGSQEEKKERKSVWKLNSDEPVSVGVCIPKSSSYKYNAPATPTAGPNSVVGISTLANAPIGPPRIGIFFTALLAMWTAKMPPIMNRPSRLPRSRATRFKTSLAKPSNCWAVRRGCRVREGLLRMEPCMSSWVMGRNTSFPHLGSRPSQSLCRARNVH